MNRAQKRSGFRGGGRILQRGEVGRERVIGQRLIPRGVDDLLGQLVDKLRVQSRPLLAQLAEALLLVDSADLLEARGLMVPLQGAHDGRRGRGRDPDDRDHESGRCGEAVHVLVVYAAALEACPLLPAPGAGDGAGGAEEDEHLRPAQRGPELRLPPLCPLDVPGVAEARIVPMARSLGHLVYESAMELAEQAVSIAPGVAEEEYVGHGRHRVEGNCTGGPV